MAIYWGDGGRLIGRQKSERLRERDKKRKKAKPRSDTKKFRDALCYQKETPAGCQR